MLIFLFIYIFIQYNEYIKFIVLRGLSFYYCTYQKLSGRPGIILLPGADYAPQIIFKTAAAIQAVVQHLLCYNTCRRFLILRSDSFSWLLHLPWPIILAGSKSRGMLLLAADFSTGAGRSFVLAGEGK